MNTHDIELPEPVARQVRYFDSNLLSTGYGKWTEWAHFHGRHERAGAYEMRDLITTTQAEAYADARVREAKQWINVDDRLPDSGLLVMVYSPPQPGDYPDSIRIEFDFICPDYEGWHNHSEHYEHFLCVAKGGADSPMTGPAEKAPYTHWMPLPELPWLTQDGTVFKERT